MPFFLRIAGRALASCATAALLAAQPAWADADAAGSLADLSRLSLEELANVEITSVSKRPEALSGAPAAVYVISNDEIRLSGADSLPEALRLAPNLQVARMNASGYGVSARGFNHSTGTSNKLQVLIDGRSIYTPLYSGVFWDAQGVMLDDVERIEVISGPGGALWGANAVNGVINVITRKAADTQGGLAHLTTGSDDTAANLRYGGRFGETGAFRIYGMAANYGESRTTAGAGGGDSWDRAQAGLKVDWGGEGDAFTLQGDLYDGSSEPVPGARAEGAIGGGNLLGSWTRRPQGGGVVEATAYYARDHRTISSGIKDSLEVYNLDLQYALAARGRHTIVVGGGYRHNQDNFRGAFRTSFLAPASRTTRLGNIFVQDEITLRDDLILTLGLKLEHNSYTGLEYLPNARLAWRPADHALFWGAVSRGVRTPSRFDRDLINPGLIAGGPTFVSEELIAYEAGYRGQPSPNLSVSVSAYYNVYDDLRTVESFTPAVFPLEIRNGMRGETYGVEAWASWQVRAGWRLTAGANALRKDLSLDPSSRDTFGVNFAGNDPSYQLSLRSHMSLTPTLDLDIDLRSIDDLKSPAVAAYTELGARLAWRVTDQVELAVIGDNLLNDQHLEFVNGSVPRREIPRSVRASLRWGF
ncbi:MAG: TonB-dependent receptor [Phenylobacterium sp.]|uniref:TonB-dependent receptor plug domain-containing protein n=1 Tax=Phenylobacterium sp. TaxID=1871053 RepID=UPI00273056F0|nr:TonB-dependent receptor [Phenylobacterium sp.]MDP2010452.1 TonB-dependent receptor [Phenylobacterium sp.]